MTHTKEWRRNWEFPYFNEYGQAFDKKDRTPYGWRVQHFDGFIMGKYVDIGYGSFVQAEAGVIIESDVELGGHVFVYSVSTIDNKRGRVTLRKGCRIGTGSVVLPGVTVGEGATVGALSLVNKDIPAGVVAYGIPAKGKTISV